MYVCGRTKCAVLIMSLSLAWISFLSTWGLALALSSLFHLVYDINAKRRHAATTAARPMVYPEDASCKNKRTGSLGMSRDSVLYRSPAYIDTNLCPPQAVLCICHIYIYRISQSLSSFLLLVPLMPIFYHLSPFCSQLASIYFLPSRSHLFPSTGSRHAYTESRSLRSCLCYAIPSDTTDVKPPYAWVVYVCGDSVLGSLTAKECVRCI